MIRRPGVYPVRRTPDQQLEALRAHVYIGHPRLAKLIKAAINPVNTYIGGEYFPRWSSR